MVGICGKKAAALAPKETRSCFRCVTSDGTKVQNVAKYLGVNRTERSLVLERRDGTKVRHNGLCWKARKMITVVIIIIIIINQMMLWHCQIEVSEDGRVSLSFNLQYKTWNSDGLSTQDSSTRYNFDLSAGKFVVEDNECNVFEVQMVRCRQAHCERNGRKFTNTLLAITDGSVEPTC